MKDVNQWRPKGSQIIVRPLTPADRTASGLLIVPEEHRERPQFGIVLAVGPGTPATATGQLLPMHTAEGDLVAFGTYAGIEFDLDGERVLIMRDAEALVGKPVGTYDLVAHPHPDRPDGPPVAMHEAAYRCEHCPPMAADETPAGGAEQAESDAPSPVILEERARLRQARDAQSGELGGGD